MDKKKWYSDGVRFECIRCGKCCEEHGDYTYVYLVQPDIESISGYLGLTTDEFLEKYCHRKGGVTFLEMRPNDSHCPFFEKGSCVIYRVRPVQCRTWPFWMGNLVKETWDDDVLPLCPGIGKGRLYTKEEIEDIAVKSEEGFDEPT